MHKPAAALSAALTVAALAGAVTSHEQRTRGSATGRSAAAATVAITGLS